MNTVQQYNIDHHHTVQWQVGGDGSGGGGEVVKKIIINNDIYNLQDINTVQRQVGRQWRDGRSDQFFSL